MTEKILIDRSVVEQALEALNSAKVWKTLNLHKLMAPQVSDAEEALRAALEQPQSNHPEIPESWKLVPVEPTKEMKSAGAFAAARANSYSPVGTYIPVDAMALMSYRVMLSAAPQPPALEQPKRQPLTDEQIDAIIKSNFVEITNQNLYDAIYTCIRDVESAHDIEE